MNDTDAIESSMRCFIFGLLSFVPVVGFFCALVAVAAYMRSSTEGWNPAKRHAMLGIIFAALGLFAHATIIAAVVLSLMVDW